MTCTVLNVAKKTNIGASSKVEKEQVNFGWKSFFCTECYHLVQFKDGEGDILIWFCSCFEKVWSYIAQLHQYHTTWNLVTRKYEWN